MQILFNGKSYASLDEMPANERQAYETMFQIFTDANGNGIPDFLEGDIAKNVVTAFSNVFHYDGKVYNDMDELPPEARQKLQDAFAKLNQLGIVTAAPPAQKMPAFEPASQPSKPLIPQEPTIQESGGRTWLFIILLLSALLVCGLAGLAVYLFMR